MTTFMFSGQPDLWKMDIVEFTGEWGKVPIANPKHMLGVIYQGSALYSINNHEYLLTEGDIIFIPWNHQWNLKACNGKACRFFHVYFAIDSEVEDINNEDLVCHILQVNESFQKNRSYCQDRPFTSVFNRFVIPEKIKVCKNYSQIKMLIDHMLEERDNPSMASGLMSTLNLSQIFALITERVIMEILDDHDIFYRSQLHPQVVEAVRYMKVHYNEEMSLCDLSDYVNVSPQYLIRLFNKEFGLTPIQYLNNVRLSVAKEMIVNTNLSFKEISTEVGIENPFYFSRLFKKCEGISPRSYKNRQLLSNSSS